MNKYLLLRDNKQSGPYTFQEIITKGIKPYDLVWLDGKSAAWRYPSEIEELKPYSPTVEEQPFDRFYKKPEAFKITAAKDHTRYAPIAIEPKIISSPVLNEDPEAAENVYINFPGKKTGEEKQLYVPVSDHVDPHSSDIHHPAPVFEQKSFSSRTDTLQPIPASLRLDQFTATPVRKSANGNNLFYAVIAACGILVILAGILIVNYYNQRQNIMLLNTMVQQMEQREKQSKQTIPPAILQPAATLTEKNNAVIPEQPADASSLLNANSGKKSSKGKSAPLPLSSEQKSLPDPIQEPSTKDEAKASFEKPVAAENLFSLVSVKPNQFRTGLLGGISNLQLELTNNSRVELHKVAVVINYLGPEKKVVKTQTVYFENVSPGKQISVDVPKSNRGVSIKYTITDIKS